MKLSFSSINSLCHCCSSATLYFPLMLFRLVIAGYLPVFLFLIGMLSVFSLFDKDSIAREM